MDRFKALPLRTLTLTSRPLSPHALSWSCDAELAVATAECIYVFLPEFACATDATDDPDASRQQFAHSLQPSAILPPRPDINARLCAQAGANMNNNYNNNNNNNNNRAVFRGVGAATIGGSASALGQVVRVEWSPSGLGCNLRPILLGLTTSGSVVAFGECVDRRATTGTASMRTRSFKNWKVLWGLGAGLPIPDDEEEEDDDDDDEKMEDEGKNGDGGGGAVRHVHERITSFAWAREVATGRALLAYANDEGEIAVMSVQHFSPRPEDDSVWSLIELGRFDARGPHGMTEPADPDFIPTGTIFSLKWSPWLVCPGYRTATLAFTARSYVGFRRVTIYDEWAKGERPNIVIEDRDTTGLCLHLSSDAFVEWEDVIWPQDDAFLARGVVATPFVVKPFELALNGILNEPMPHHSPWQCMSVYPEDESSTNPITGLVIHHPGPYGSKPETPLYSLVRQSATPTNTDWYQSNLPDVTLPQWAEDLGDQTARLVPRGAALEGVDSDFDDSDSDDGDDRTARDARPLQPQVHPHRFRLWGLAQSPGGGCSALLASRHSTQHPNRRGFCSVHFDWQVPGEDEGDAARRVPWVPLTTEGKVWEWMYGMGDEVPGATSATTTMTAGGQSSVLREQLKFVVLQRLPCVFCGSSFTVAGDEATCGNGHSFATCAASGVPIMAPGVSRVCGVCKLRCLKVSELKSLARDYLGSDEGIMSASGEVCGGCGGKFVV